MHSSISSSNDRIPPKHWGRTWLMTLVLTVGCVAVSEWALRCAGFEPSVSDDQMLWSVQRDKVHRCNSSRSVVLLGASRMLLGFVPEAFNRHFPHYRVYQLAVSGQHPVATLCDLAEDENFCGIVICAITAAGFTPARLDDQKGSVDYYHRVYANLGYLDKLLNRQIATSLQKRLAFFNGSISPSRVYDYLCEYRKLPEPFYAVACADRSMRADYSKLADLERKRAPLINRLRREHERTPPPSPERWLDDALRLEPLVQRIQERGGKVVFVRFITTDEHYDIDEHYWPKSDYWDRFAASTQATTIHFMDVPQLQDFECPDGSHLGYHDAVRYTEALARELELRKIIVRSLVDH